MRRIITFLMLVAILLSFAACKQDISNMDSTPVTTASDTVPTTQPTPPPTTVPSTPDPSMGPTCPPVEGDLYWGEFRGKGFKNPNGIDAPISSIMLYSDGTCEYKRSIFSSSWPGPTVWTFDGEHLYIGSIESGSYSTFLYVGAEDPNESKLIFVKSGHDISGFDRLPDGQVFNFAGVMPYTGSTDQTVPPTTEPEQTVPPTTEPTVRPTCPPVEGDIYWGMHDGKVFSRRTKDITYILYLFSDGTFKFRVSTIKDHEDHGIWNLEGDLLYLIGLDEDGNETGHISCFQYIPGQADGSGHLIFIKGSNDLPNLSQSEDRAIYQWAGASSYPA